MEAFFTLVRLNTALIYVIDIVPLLFCHHQVHCISALLDYMLAVVLPQDQVYMYEQKVYSRHHYKGMLEL